MEDNSLIKEERLTTRIVGRVVGVDLSKRKLVARLSPVAGACTALLHALVQAVGCAGRKDFVSDEIR